MAKTNLQYGRTEYLSDLKNKDLPHIKSMERFEAFYEEVGKDIEAIKDLKYFPDRLFFVKPKGRILELGCHFGYNLFHYASLGFECVGVEISQSLIDYGMKMWEKESQFVKDRVTFIHSWIELFVPEMKYDTILLTQTLEHVMEPINTLEKAAECLADDGVLYIAVPETKWGNSSHVRGIDRKEMEKLLHKAGLVAIEWFEITNPEETALSARKA